MVVLVLSAPYLFCPMLPAKDGGSLRKPGQGAGGWLPTNDRKLSWSSNSRQSEAASKLTTKPKRSYKFLFLCIRTLMETKQTWKPHNRYYRQTAHPTNRPFLLSLLEGRCMHIHTIPTNMSDPLPALLWDLCLKLILLWPGLRQALWDEMIIDSLLKVVWWKKIVSKQRNPTQHSSLCFLEKIF